MPPTIANCNDGSARPPRLRLDLNLGTLHGLAEWSACPRGSEDDVFAALREAGFEGVQGGSPDAARRRGLGCTTGGRVDAPAEAEPLARRCKDDGYECATLHVGRGLEDDEQIDALIDAMIAASVKHDFPLYIEIHRSTITQDIWRTTRFAQRHPGLRFNGDFSHWYTGLEMTYAGLQRNVDFAAPVFDRVRFLHGRIGNSGHIQMPFAKTPGEAFVADFKLMWQRCFAGFLSTAKPGDYICFAPELLGPIGYANLIAGPDGAMREDTDRWLEALAMVDIARDAFQAASVEQV